MDPRDVIITGKPTIIAGKSPIMGSKSQIQRAIPRAVAKTMKMNQRRIDRDMEQENYCRTFNPPPKKTRV